MIHPSVALAAVAVCSMQLAAAHAQSVYVAPGAVYIGSARVYVSGPTHDGSAYVTSVPSYGGPALYSPSYGYESPATMFEPRVYGEPRIYAPPNYGEQEPAYGGRDFADGYVPRPPADVPFGRHHHCLIPFAGRWCN
jgi:hypothetical protein